MKPGVWVALAFAITLCSAAHGQDQREEPKRNAVSFKPLSIASRGLALQYERLTLPRMSVVAGAAARSSANGDFSSATWALISEGRWWILGREPFSRFKGMAGPYAGLVLNAGRTSVTATRSGRSLGGMYTVKESMRLGYRFMFAHLQEVTLSGSVDAVHEFDDRGRLATITYLTVGADLTVGWVF
jgi:hypothetical protein